METKKLEKMMKQQMDIDLFGLHKAIGAVKELCRSRIGGHLYDVVTERLDAEYDATLTKMVAMYNGLVDRVNEARARLAGDDVNLEAVKGEQSYTTCKTCTVEIRDFGISRIGESDAWCLRLNMEDIDGTAMKEEDAKRIMEAVREWRDKKLAAERESGASEENEARNG